MAIGSFVLRLLRGVVFGLPAGLFAPWLTVSRNGGLFRLLIQREVVARTSGTVLGGLWVLAQPALQVAALWFLLDVVLQVRFPGQAPFLNYFLIGMLPWLTINEILQRNLTILAEFGALYQRTVFPVHVLPMLPLAVTGITYGVIYAVVVALLQGPVAALYSLGAIALLMVWMVPLCYLFAVVGLFLKDARQIIPFVLTLLMYATPILYLPDALPKSLRFLISFNPLADVMALLHALLQGMPWSLGNAARPLLLWLLLLGPAWLVFRRAEPHMREAL